VQVHCDEGVAIHIDPESCAGGREAVREALTGARIGQPLSRERSNPGCRRCLGSGRQHDLTRYASVRPARRGRRPWHVRTLFVHGNREISGLTPGGSPLRVRIGKARSRSR
jgi:hypothetical protein